jgi:hypothetical protein
LATPNELELRRYHTRASAADADAGNPMHKIKSAEASPAATAARTVGERPYLDMGR